MLVKGIRNIFKVIKNSLRIYKADITKILTNWVSLVVIGGLICLPSLYAWVNIYASWDPYGSTEGIKVGIVNEDRGGSIKDTDINVGEEVVESLMENDALGWIFYETREEGLEEVDKGEVYATIIIPSNFSEKIVTLVDEEPTKPELEYYINEKINAIAPKITDKGATTIQSQITTSFVETVADKVIDVMHSVGIELDAAYPIIERLEDTMQNLSDKCPELEDRLQSLADSAQEGKVVIDRNDKNVESLQGLITQLIDFNGDISESLVELSTKPEEVIPDLREDLVLLQTIFADISSSTLELKETIELNKPDLINDIDSGITRLENAKVRLTELADKAEELDKDLSSSIKSTTNELIDILDDYETTFRRLQTKLDDTDEALALLDKLANLNKAAANDITKLKQGIQAISQNLNKQLAVLQALIAKIENIQIPGMTPPSSPTVPDTSTPSEGDNSAGTPDANSPDSGTSDSSTSDTQPDDSAGADEPVTTLEGRSTVDADFAAEINEAIALAEEAQEAISENPDIFGSASYAVSDIQSYLATIKNLINNPTALVQYLNNLKAAARNLSGTIGNIRMLIEVRTNALAEKLTTLSEVMSEAGTMIKGLSNTISTVADGGQEKIDRIINNIHTVQDKLYDVQKRVTKTLHSEADRIQDQVIRTNSDLTKLQENLERLNTKLQDKTVVEDILGNTSQLTYSIQASLDNIIERLDSDLIARLKERIMELTNFVNDVTSLLGSVQTELDHLRDFGQRLGDKSVILSEDLLEVKGRVPDLKERIDKVKDKITELNENVDIRELIDQLTADNSDKSDFLASPVELNTNTLYPIENYGTGLTPFYTTLCLWVGALLLTALLSTKSHNVDFAYTPIEEYFGKYLLFGTCAVLQGLIASFGDIVILGVKPQHPVLFVMLAMFYSAVFMAIVYTLVALFSNIGKAIGVVLLVVQIGGSGGTFPIQMTPTFFQRVHNLLPFTYGISGMREAIGGIYTATLIQDVTRLGLFFVGILIIGALLKKKANHFLHKYSEQLGKSGVTGH